MNANNNDISAFYDVLKVIEEYKSLHKFSDKRCIFFAAFPNEISLYYYFGVIVNLHDYLNELNETFNKHDCFEKFLWSPLKIYFYHDFDQRSVFNFYIKLFTKKKINNK